VGNFLGIGKIPRNNSTLSFLLSSLLPSAFDFLQRSRGAMLRLQLSFALSFVPSKIHISGNGTRSIQTPLLK
jgi:hypothetical protein